MTWENQGDTSSPTDRHQQAGQRTLANMLAPTALRAPSSQRCWPHDSKACAGLAEGCSGCAPAAPVRQVTPGLRRAQRLRPEAARGSHPLRRLVPRAAAQQTAAKPTPLGSMTAPMRPSGSSGNEHLEGKLKVIGERPALHSRFAVLLPCHVVLAQCLSGLCTWTAISGSLLVSSWACVA